MKKWRPVETAPMGRPVLVWDPYHLMRMAVRYPEGWKTDLPYDPTGYAPVIYPTHWMWPPKPPQDVPPSENGCGNG